MRIYANEDAQNRLHQLWELANDMVDLLNDNGISSADLVNYEFYNNLPVGMVSIEIDGDWKHDHLYADELMEENFSVFKVDKAITEDTGSDWYPAIHTYYVSARF